MMVTPQGGQKLPLILKPNEQTGQLYEKKAVTGDQVSPVVFDYGSYNPFVEKPFVGGPFTGGMGEDVQSSEDSKRYKYAENADLSIGGQRRIAAKFHTEHVVSAGPGLNVNCLENGRDATAGDTLFALVDRYVYLYRSGWVLSKDSGGAAWLQGVQFQGSAGSNRFWATNEAGELWGYDGTSWTQATLPAGAVASYVERVGTSLVILSGATGSTHLNEYRVCNAGDPLLAASWGGPIYVGDYGKRGTWLRSLGSQVFVFKEDGIFTVNEDGSVNDLFEELRNVPVARYGRNASRFNSALWFAFGATFWKMTGGATATLTPVGLERMVDLDPSLQRSPVAFAGHNSWFGYLATDADLFKYGTWVNTGQVGANYQFSDVWNGSLKKWNAKAPTYAVVTGNVGNQTRLYVGFDDGSVDWCVLPSTSPDPADDPACEYTDETSYVYWPDHHAMAQADTKHFRTFVPEGPLIDATRYATISYRTDPDAAWTDLASALDSPGKRVSTPSGGVTGLTLQVREQLHGTTTSTPRIEAITLLEQTRPAMIKIFQATARAARNLVRRDGMIDRRTGEQVRAALEAVADGSRAEGAGPVTVLFPDETTQAIDVVDYEAVQIPDSYGLAWDVALKFVSFVTNTVFGTWDRAVYRNWDDAASYSWDQTGRW